MRKGSLTGLSLGLLLLVLSPAVSAATLTIEFSAEGSSPNPNTLLQGRIDFSSDGVDSNASSVVGSYTQVVTALSLSLTDLGSGGVESFSFAPGPSTQNGLLVLNAYYDAGRGVTIDYFAVRAPVATNALDVQSVEIALESLSDVLPSDGIPNASQLNELGTNAARVRVFMSEVFFLLEPLDYLAVPEPSACALLGIASLVLLLRRVTLSAR